MAEENLRQRFQALHVPPTMEVFQRGTFNVLTGRGLSKNHPTHQYGWSRDKSPLFNQSCFLQPSYQLQMMLMASETPCHCNIMWIEFDLHWNLSLHSAVKEIQNEQAVEGSEIE